MTFLNKTLKKGETANMTKPMKGKSMVLWYFLVGECEVDKLEEKLFLRKKQLD